MVFTSPLTLTLACSHTPKAPILVSSGPSQNMSHFWPSAHLKLKKIPVHDNSFTQSTLSITTAAVASAEHIPSGSFSSQPLISGAVQLLVPNEAIFCVYI